MEMLGYIKVNGQGLLKAEVLGELDNRLRANYPNVPKFTKTKK